ncbi:MAG: hypothetical protein V4577_04255 [Bacteroidota bacterium]
MNKLSNRPIYSLHDTDFIVDIDKQVLREAERPSNEISFVNDMKDMGNHYLLNYDIVEKTCTPAVLDPLTWLPFHVPPLVELDPAGMSEKYGIPVSELAGKTDFDIIVDQEALTLRRQGVLPHVNIAGEDFIIDLRLHELRHKQYFFPVISLKSFELTNDGWSYEAFYQPVMKQVVEIDPKLTEFPEGVIRIRIPNEIGLDPVETARQYGMEERELLRRYPIQAALKAEVVPLSETHIPSLIQRNREQLQQEHQEIARRIKPRIRPKF